MAIYIVCSQPNSSSPWRHGVNATPWDMRLKSQLRFNNLYLNLFNWDSWLFCSQNRRLLCRSMRYLKLAISQYRYFHNINKGRMNYIHIWNNKKCLFSRSEKPILKMRIVKSRECNFCLNILTIVVNRNRLI